MEIKFAVSKKNIIISLIFFCICAYGAAINTICTSLGFVLYIFLFAGYLFSYKIKEKFRVLADVVFCLICGLYVSFALPQLLLGESEGRPSIIQLMICKYSLFSVIAPFLYVLIVYVFIRMLTNSPKLTLMLTPLPFLVLMFIDYFVLKSRSSEITAADIYSISTAATVAPQYKIDLAKPILIMVLPYIIYLIIIAMRVNVEKSKHSRWFNMLISFLVLLVICPTIYYISKEKSKEQTVYTFGLAPTTGYGFYYTFVTTYFKLMIDIPEGYSAEKLQAYAQEAEADNQQQQLAYAGEDKPNVIVIMNESFFDFDVMGTRYEYDDPIPYWHSLEKSYVHGYAYSSAYGGNTANSEFELLTGQSIAFFPSSVIPYSLYLTHNVYSLPQTFEANGYSTVAMHPNTGYAWNRINAYPNLGFDNMMFLTDFDYQESDMERGYLTDECAYNNLISVLEDNDSNSTAPIFALLVTIQNHGSYEPCDGFSVNDYVSSSDFEYSAEVNTYLTLIHESDQALEEFLTYLEGQDEKYEVLMFGDHIPSLTNVSDFVNGDVSDQFLVPYMIWTNYDIDQECLANSEEFEYTSLNYLGLKLLSAAGIEENTYWSFIDVMRHYVPAMNAYFYYSIEEHELLSYPDDISSVPGLIEYDYFVYNAITSETGSILAAS